LREMTAVHDIVNAYRPSSGVVVRLNPGDQLIQAADRITILKGPNWQPWQPRSRPDRLPYRQRQSRGRAATTRLARELEHWTQTPSSSEEAP
jgi:hypothetical protein